MALYGYLVVAGVFTVYIFVAGFINSFGVFVDQFDRDFCQPNDCLDILALVSALALANYRLLCWLVVILERRISSATLFIVGFLLCVTSMISTSYISSLTLLFITHSLLYGFGSTLMLNSPLTIIESYFPKHHPRHVLTTSIMNLGAPIGVVVMNPLAVYLDEHEAHSWRDTLKILGGAIACAGIFYLATLIRPFLFSINDSEYEDIDDKNNLEFVEQEKKSLWSSLLSVFNPLSTAWIVGLYLVSSGIFIPKTLFMQYMTNTKNITEEDAALVMSLSGVAEATCSFIISIIGDYLSFHILSIYVGGSALLSIGCYLLQYATSWTHIAIYSIMHGAVDGFLMTVLFSVVRHVTVDNSQCGIMWSLTNLAVGLGQLTGLPVAGFLYDKYRTYDRVFEFAAVLFLTNTIMFLITYIVRICRSRHRRLPEHVSKLQAALSYDEPFEEVDDSEAPLANNKRPRIPSSAECNPPAPNVAP